MLWWAGPDSDRRPSARQADVLTRLDDRPTSVHVFYVVFLYRRFVSGALQYWSFSVLLSYFPLCLLAMIANLSHLAIIILPGARVWPQLTKCYLY